ncbi:hypothetical protein OOZ15_10295 [Galbibacter sp. EGI 63066]|uniref:hypothetical protein n=1 Tax=Galbibacter sp. EGI 63066 TaxID=2993559 RepID=UPI002248E652|nr:hypothetical protein [Galbibacter sp. EGI 63066]MCX2680330.1 hypothetical protein [Galbibacter sp. EGI 63066]
MNPFYLITPINKNDKPNPLNKIFGPSPVVPEEMWPKVGELFYHHIISFDARDLVFPQNNKVMAISIFQSPVSSGNFEKDFFKIVRTSRIDNVSQRLSYPKGYLPWWSGHPKESIFSTGLPFTLEEQNFVPQHIIKEGLACKDEFYPIPYEYEKIENFQSYIGGFPVWIQGNESPIQENGEPADFLMKLSGFDDWFQMSIINGYDLYVFLTDSGELKYIGQS